MADYGYTHKEYDHEFYPDKGPYYWYSSKVFREPTTTVPKDYLAYLMDLYVEHARSRGQIVVAKPKLTLKNGKYTMHGVGLSEPGRKVMERFGWENPCGHDWLPNPRKGYNYCVHCHEVDCSHSKETLVRINGVVDPRWVCESCGKVTGEIFDNQY